MRTMLMSPVNFGILFWLCVISSTASQYSNLYTIPGSQQLQQQLQLKEQNQLKEQYKQLIQKQKDDFLQAWQPTPEMMKKFPYYLSGYDEEERPIWIYQFGIWDIKREVDLGGEYLRNMSIYIDQMFWRLTKSIDVKSTPEYPVSDCVVILDMENYSMLQLSVPTLQFIFQKAREIEPSTPHLEQGFIINVHFVGQTLINFMRPVMGSFLSKSKIYGTNKSKWIPDLLRRLPKTQLPPWYGGTSQHKPVVVYGK